MSQGCTASLNNKWLPGGGCDVGKGGMGLSSRGIFDPTCSVKSTERSKKA